MRLAWADPDDPLAAEGVLAPLWAALVDNGLLTVTAGESATLR